jgi:hypothetical protein
MREEQARLDYLRAEDEKEVTHKAAKEEEEGREREKQEKIEQEKKSKAEEAKKAKMAIILAAASQPLASPTSSPVPSPKSSPVPSPKSSPVPSPKSSPRKPPPSFRRPLFKGFINVGDTLPPVEDFPPPLDMSETEALDNQLQAAIESRNVNALKALLAVRISRSYTQHVILTLNHFAAC